MTDLTIESIPIETLRPYPRNARTHSKKQIRQIADSIRTFGFTNPVLIDDANIDPRRSRPGRGREAARPARRCPAGSIAHDRGAEARLCPRRQQARAECRLGRGTAGDELQGLLATDLDFDIGADRLLDPRDRQPDRGPRAPEEPGDPEDDVLPDLGDGPRDAEPAISGARTASADLRRRARCRHLVAALMDGDERAQMVFTDPPYNVPIDGHVGGSGAHQAPRVRHGVRRDEPGRVHRVSSRRPSRHLDRAQPSTARSTSSAWTGGTCGEMLVGGRGRLHRAQEPDRLGEGQWRHGHLLPLPPRADLRLQERRRPAHQRLRARPARPLPHQCLGVPRRQHAEGRAAWKSWRCIRPSSRSR